MSISGIETSYQKYALSSNSSAKSSDSASAFDSFQNELVNWEKRVKETIDKEQDNDSSGNIQMSEKQWRNLMKKVDSAIDASKDNLKTQEQETKKQVKEKNQVPKLKIEQSM